MYMKKIIVLFIVSTFAGQLVQAQGITYLSNIGQSSVGNLAVGSDSWYAAQFFTGDNTGGYVLDSVQLGMADASGNPNSFTVMIYGTGNNPSAVLPGNSLGSLSGSLNPVTAGTYSYTPASSLTLLPNTDYFIVLTAGTAVANGAYEWSFAGANSYNPSGRWGASGVTTSNNGSSWSRTVADFPEYAITATAVPEPSAVSLILFGSGVFIYARRKCTGK
jgi:hypothetical protein